MKSPFKSAATLSVLLAGFVSWGVASAVDVGASVTIGQPGLYGRIDIGRVPTPEVIYAEPVIIESVPVAVVRRPIYLHVPPGHEKHWEKHCAQYGACGQPVYFVREDWYERTYSRRPIEREVEDDDDHHGHGHGNGRGRGRGHRDD